MKTYWKRMYQDAKRSWTMWVAAIWIVIGVAETQMQLLQPLIGEKYFGVLSIVISSTLALARMRGLSKDIKAGK